MFHDLDINSIYCLSYHIQSVASNSFAQIEICLIPVDLRVIIFVSDENEILIC